MQDEILVERYRKEVERMNERCGCYASCGISRGMSESKRVAFNALRKDQLTKAFCREVDQLYAF